MNVVVLSVVFQFLPHYAIMEHATAYLWVIPYQINEKKNLTPSDFHVIWCAENIG